MKHKCEWVKSSCCEVASHFIASVDGDTYALCEKHWEYYSTTDFSIWLGKAKKISKEEWHVHQVMAV